MRRVQRAQGTEGPDSKDAGPALSHKHGEGGGGGGIAGGFRILRAKARGLGGGKVRAETRDQGSGCGFVGDIGNANDELGATGLEVAEVPEPAEERGRGGLEVDSAGAYEGSIGDKGPRDAGLKLLEGEGGQDEGEVAGIDLGAARGIGGRRRRRGWHSCRWRRSSGRVGCWEWVITFAAAAAFHLRSSRGGRRLRRGRGAARGIGGRRRRRGWHSCRWNSCRWRRSSGRVGCWEWVITFAAAAAFHLRSSRGGRRLRRGRDGRRDIWCEGNDRSDSHGRMPTGMARPNLNGAQGVRGQLEEGAPGSRAFVACAAGTGGKGGPAGSFPCDFATDSG